MTDAPSPFPWIDLAIILALVALNGVFAMSELAIVSARKPRLEAMARAGKRGARTALTLTGDPGRFLSTVQIGITLIGIVAGAYSGASLGGPVGARLAQIGLPASWGFGVVIALTTYVSLIVGELVPKQFALRAPEAIAVVMAPVMRGMAFVTAPFVWLLDGTSLLIFRLLRLDRESEQHVTAEELHLIVAEASNAGVIEESERAIISGVVRLADRPVREVMTPRIDVDWIDLDAEPETLAMRLAAMPHSRIPVANGSVDEIIGVVQARDLVAALIAGETIDLRALTRDAPVVTDRMDAMDVLGVLREAEVPVALVHDEYGHFEGLVTPADLLAAIAGAFASDRDEDSDPPVHEREDGSFLLSGSCAADVMADRLGFALPEDRDYATVAGHALSVLRHLPKVGEVYRDRDWTFEIVDIDGRKIDKVLASRVTGRR